MAGDGKNIFELGLDPTPANFQPQTPLTFLDWAASVYPDKAAVILPYLPCRSSGAP